MKSFAENRKKEKTMPIDFEKRFIKYIYDYKTENETDDAEFEELIPELYDEWLDTPASWLGGSTPGSYFNSFGAAESVKALGEYFFSDIKIPGMLLNRITDLREEAYPLLLSLLIKYEGEKACELKTLIVELIEEMELNHPYDYYIDVIARSSEPDDFPEACVKELKNTGEKYKEKIIEMYESAQSNYSADCFLDILADLPYDERSYDFALEKLVYDTDKKAFYASCLGKLGNEKALPYLEEAIKANNIKYFEFEAIRNAIEELGGEVTAEREFEDDEDYETFIKHGGED